MASLHSRARRRLGRSLRTLCHAACVFFAASAITSRAFGDASFALSWHRDTKSEACVTEAALRDALERRLGHEPFVAADRADILIDGEERAVGRDRFRARVTQRDRRGALLGSRELEAQSCAGLLRAATIVVALIIDPEGNGATGGKPAEPPSAKPPSAVPPARPPPSSPRTITAEPFRAAPTRPSSMAFQLVMGGGVGTSIGVLPSASVTIHALGRLEAPRSRWSFDWRGSYSFAQALRDGNVRGDFAAMDQQVRACFAFSRWPAGKLDVCGGIVWGAVLPTTTGVRSGNDSWRVIVGPTVGAALQLRRGSSSAPAARLDVGFALPLREYAFFYLDVGNEQKRFYSTEGVILFVSLSGLGTISS